MKNMFDGVMHGLVLKIASILCKVIFLFIVVPNLIPGEFSSYVFILTSSLLAARIMSGGIGDQLPVIIAGNVNIAKKIYWYIKLMMLLSLLIFILASFTSNAYIVGMALTCALIINSYIEGVLRSICPNGYEQLINIPWVLFLFFGYMFEVNNASSLIAIYTLCVFVTQAILMLRFGMWKEGRYFDIKKKLPALRAVYKAGVVKAISEVLYLANSRALVLWPKWMGFGGLSDKLTLALTIAETVSTLPMVMINRNYNKYCARMLDEKKNLISMLIIMIIMLSAAGAAYILDLIEIKSYFLNLTDLSMIDKLDLYWLSWALALYAAVCAGYELRYYRWGYGLLERPVFLMQMVFFLCQGLVIYTFGPELGLKAICLSVLAAAFIYLSFRLTYMYSLKGLR